MAAQAISAGYGPLRYAARTTILTERDLVRAAIVVGGIWLIMSSILSSGSIFATVAETSVRLDEELPDLYENLLFFTIPVAIGVAALGVLPGVYAILSADKWASRFVSQDRAAPEIRPSLLVCAGAMLLGLSTGVTGAISLSASAIGIVVEIAGGTISEYMLPTLIRQAIFGLCSVVAGVLLFNWGGRQASRAA